MWPCRTIPALALASLLSSGCAERPDGGGAREETPGKEPAAAQRRDLRMLPSFAARDGRVVVPLTWERLSERAAARLGAQVIVLGPSPAPGLTAPPDITVPRGGDNVVDPTAPPGVEEGILHHGALHLGARPSRASGSFSTSNDRGTPRGSNGGGRDVFVAVLETPKPGEGGEWRPWQLFIDRDLDGDLREERPVPARARSESGGGIEVRTARFPVVEILGPMGGVHALLVTARVIGAGPVGPSPRRRGFGPAGGSTALSGRRGPGRRSAVLQAQTACALSGRVRIFGAERDVAIYDADANGMFGDYAESVDRTGDVIWIDFDADRKLDDGEVLFLAPRLVHEGKVAALELSPGTRRLAVADVDVPLGGIRPAGVDPSAKVSVQLFSEEYRLVAPGPGDLVPAGSYTLVRYAIRQEDVDGSEWVLAGGWIPGSSPSVRVREGETAELAFGPPIEARAWVRPVEGLRAVQHVERHEPRGAPPGSVLIMVTLRGSARENVRLGFRADGRERLADWGVYRVLDGDMELARGKLRPSPGMPGAGMAVWVPDAGETGPIEKGKRLHVEVTPDCGPFEGGFKGRTEFEYGRPTPIRLVVSEVQPGTQAERVGLRAGDVILRYDSKRVDGPMDLMRAMRAARGKARVELAVARGAVGSTTLSPPRGAVGSTTLSPPRGGPPSLPRSFGGRQPSVALAKEGGGREIRFALLPGEIGIVTVMTLP